MQRLTVLLVELAKLATKNGLSWKALNAALNAFCIASLYIFIV